MSEAEKVDLDELDVQIAEELQVDESKPEIAEPEYSEIEQKAIDEGWNPDKSKLPEGTKFYSAEEYLDRGTFFRKIDTQKAEIERMKAQMEHLSDNYRKANERELKKAEKEYKAIIDGLKAEKVQALDEGDHHRVVEIDEQMRAAEAPQAEAPTPNHAIADKIIGDWKAENTWYDNDEALGEQADILASQYARKNIPLEEALPKISARMKELFPHKFENKRRSGAASVEGGGSPQPKTGKVSEKSLTAEELSMYRDLGMDKVLKSDADKQEYFRNVIASRAD